MRTRAVAPSDLPPLIERIDPDFLPQEADPERAWLTAAFLNHRSTLRRYARRLGADGWLADDLVSETFLKAWRRVQATNVKPDNTEAYLLRVERNLYVDHCLREARLRQLVEVLERVTSAAEEDDDAFARLTVAAAIQELPNKLRDVLVCRYYLGLSMGETAEVLCLPSAGSAAATAHRARHALRARLVPGAAGPATTGQPATSVAARR